MFELPPLEAVEAVVDRFALVAAPLEPRPPLLDEPAPVLLPPRVLEEMLVPPVVLDEAALPPELVEDELELEEPPLLPPVPVAAGQPTPTQDAARSSSGCGYV